MTTTPERTATLTSLVAAEIRAWLGRLDVRPSELARRMGENDQWMSTRLKGRTPINVNDLQRFADALGVTVIQLLPASARVASRSQGAGTGSGVRDLNVSSCSLSPSDDGRRAVVHAPEGRPTRHLAAGTGPYGGGRRDAVRPARPSVSLNRPWRSSSQHISVTADAPTTWSPDRLAASTAAASAR